MQVIGKVLASDLGQMQRRGLEPRQALDILLNEAKRLYPQADAIIMQRDPATGGFSIVAL